MLLVACTQRIIQLQLLCKAGSIQGATSQLITEESFNNNPLLE